MFLIRFFSIGLKNYLGGETAVWESYHVVEKNDSLKNWKELKSWENRKAFIKKCPVSVTDGQGYKGFQIGDRRAY